MESSRRRGGDDGTPDVVVGETGRHEGLSLKVGKSKTTLFNKRYVTV